MLTKVWNSLHIFFSQVYIEPTKFFCEYIDISSSFDIIQISSKRIEIATNFLFVIYSQLWGYILIQFSKKVYNRKL